MLGVSFGELGVLFAVALMVLGPTRLPGLVRKMGRWVGKARTMAREFQQQLESEVNLDELNRMTDEIKLQAQGSTPAPPPDFTADPPATQPATESGSDNLAASGYPYGAQDPAPETYPDLPPDQPPDMAPPLPGDDTYSHAHAEGEAPLADEPPATDPDTSQKKDSDVA
jgi:sec-independent protein translocase protein TatB